MRRREFGGEVDRAENVAEGGLGMSEPDFRAAAFPVGHGKFAAQGDGRAEIIERHLGLREFQVNGAARDMEAG